jgi:hypothetical protein
MYMYYAPPYRHPGRGQGDTGCGMQSRKRQLRDGSWPAERQLLAQIPGVLHPHDTMYEENKADLSLLCRLWCAEVLAWPASMGALCPLQHPDCV